MNFRNRANIDKTPLRNSIVNTIMILFLIFFVLYTFYINYHYAGLDSDIVNEIVYRQTSYLQKTLYPEGYVCGHESFSGRPVLLYWLFYAITNDFMLSFYLENACTLTILLILVYLYLRKIGITISYALFGVCVFVITVSDAVRYVAFSPMNPYILFIFVALITLILRVNIKEFLFGTEENGSRKLFLSSVTASFIIAALIGYTTMKLVLVLYIPLLFIDFFPLIWKYINGRTMQKPQIKLCAISLGILIVNVISYILFLKTHGETINPMAIVITQGSRWLQWDVLSAQLSAILYLFGTMTGGETKSVSGIMTLLTVAYILLGFIVFIWFIKSGRSEKNHSYIDAFYFCFVSTGFMSVYQILTGVNISIERYYFITGLLIPIIYVVAIFVWSKKYKLPYSLFPVVSVGLGVTLLFTLSIYSDYISYNQKSETSLEKVANYIEEHGYSYVTASYWNAGVITGYTNGSVDAQHTGSMSIFKPYLWITDTRKYTDPKIGVPNILLITDEEEATMDSNLALMLKYEGTKVAEIDEYNLYEFYENPFVLVEDAIDKYSGNLPTQVGVPKIVTPQSGEFITDTGTMNDNGFLLSDGTGGFVMYGPYKPTNAGSYDIVLNYTILSYEGTDEGIADITVDIQTICSTSIAADSSQIKFEDVAFDDGHTFEVRVSVPEGMIIQIESIEYTKTS